ncbi:porin [Shewanella glacialipiscicola]|uniref:porin n=1 Tax=Shewanella glacialipiscicola TaxID=614069 RepID=UPI0021DB50BE|nr:porin [Shewanella glacialipiscicola]MCU7994084.1 porin [Shewanella glacialipiscicola]MCU8025402.1 porin [Shewanella glacialipiscicola]
MKLSKITAAMMMLSFTAPLFAAQANDTATNDELRAELQQIQQRLATLETQESTASTPTSSDTQFNFYGSLRPTFGVSNLSSDEVWDVGDASSRIGFAAEQKLSHGLTGFAKGEFKVDIKNDGDFGDARLAYVGIEGLFGRFAIGKQAVTQEIISDPVDIFNRSGTPLAYDSASPFRVNNLVTYRKQFGDFLFSADGQFDGDKGSDGSDFVNAGVRYKTDFIYIAAAFYNKELEDGTDENTVGVTLSKSFDSLYLAAAYQDIDKDDADGSTLDVVASYAINESYKVKLGVSQYDDGGNDVTSKTYNAYNTTFEWHLTPMFRTFVEYQKTDYDYRETNDQIMIGMRYNFDYKF